MPLQGIDPLESDQSCGAADGGSGPCGQVARDRQAGLVAGNSVTRDLTDTDRYGRAIRTCFIGAPSGRDMNAWVVRQGLAVAYMKFSQAYVAEEAQARSERRGIWQGDFTPSWIYRQQHAKSW